jgi:ABC-type phosphate transport system auxiliary subunit
MDVVNPRLDDFVKAMRAKMALDRNTRKVDWRDLSGNDTMHMLMEEIAEYFDVCVLASAGREDWGAVYDEAVDIANVAFMMADAVKAWHVERGVKRVGA